MHHVTHIQSLPVLPDKGSINTSLAFCEFKIFAYLRTYMAISKQDKKPTPLVFTAFKTCCEMIFNTSNAEAMQEKMKERIQRMVQKVVTYFTSESELLRKFKLLDQQDKYMLQHYGGAWLLCFYEAINVIYNITIEDSEPFTFIQPISPRLSMHCLDEIIQRASDSGGAEIFIVTPHNMNVENWVKDINIRQIYQHKQRVDRSNRCTYAGSANMALHKADHYPLFSSSSRSVTLL